MKLHICTLLWIRQTLMLEGTCDFGPELIISGAMYRGDLNDKQHDHVTVSCDILLAHSPYWVVDFFPMIGHVVHTIVVQFYIALQRINHIKGDYIIIITCFGEKPASLSYSGTHTWCVRSMLSGERARWVMLCSVR